MTINTEHQSSHALEKGTEATFEVTRCAHGGEGIAVFDGRVVFIRGAYPGDIVRAQIHTVKKNFAKAELIEVMTPSPLRVAQRCEAAAQGAGCCDFGDLDPEKEAEFKAEIVRGQLEKIGRVNPLPPIEVVDLAPHAGWRSRVRLGVDAHGRAGVRKAQSTDVIAGLTCAQVVPGLCDGVIGADAQRFTPGAEVIVVRDDAGARHVVEVRKASRGRRSETVTKVLEGSGVATQKVGAWDFEIPATAFWQAHTAAVSAYSTLIARWAQPAATQEDAQRPGPVVAWDLYGGVGAFAPALFNALGNAVEIHSVESSKSAALAGRKVLGDKVVFHSAMVENVVSQLPKPQVVVLDPPRVGAGARVIEAVAQSRPKRVIHIGCDPATFARDVYTWSQQGYELSEAVVFNAFPGTHHCETIGLLLPKS